MDKPVERLTAIFTITRVCNVAADCFSRQDEWRFALSDYEQALDLALEPEPEQRKRALIDEIHMRLALTHYMIGTSIVGEHQVRSCS